MAETITFSAPAYRTLLCILLVAVLLKLKAVFSRGGGLNLPPGPWPLPVIGNMHSLVGALPHHALRRLAQRYGPVMLLRLGHVRAVVVSSPEAAREVLKTHDAIFASRPLYVTMGIFTYGGQNISFSPYGSKHWKEVRRLCATELLSPKRVLSFRPIREQEAARLVAAVASSSAGVVNLSERTRVVMYDILMRCAISELCPIPMRDEYIDALEEGLNLLAGFNLIDLFPGSRLARMLGAASLRAATQSHDRLHHITQAIIQDHANKKGPDGSSGENEEEDMDILSVLLRLQRDGGLAIDLTTEVVSAVLFDVFSAGPETSATTAIWAMSQLVRSPRAMERAQSEVRRVLRGKARVTEADVQGRLPFLQMVVKETLRLHPPAPLILPRLSAESTKILGYDVPEGTTVFVNVWAIGRDDKAWPDAGEFRPERFEDDVTDFMGADFRLLPGGAGRRMCPGLTFGVANVEIALANLLYHFDWKLPGGADPRGLDMTETCGITARRKTDLLLEATPFVPTSMD